MWAISAAAIWGIVPLLEKLGLVTAKPLAGLFYRCVGVVVGFVWLAAFMVKPQELKSVDGRSIVLLMLAGLLASVVAQIAFYNGLKLGEVSRVVPISGSYPFIAFLLGIFFLGESVNLMKIGGVLLILAGIWLLKIG